MATAQVQYVISGDASQDGSYPLFIIIDSSGVQWKLRIDTLGVLSTEAM